MLEAELRGKMPDDSTDNEDLLTSTVFGLLKYIPPVFWSEILNRAKSRGGMSFIDKCNQCGLRIDDYDCSLSI